jgi:Flp pilus assembly protein TadD
VAKRSRVQSPEVAAQRPRAAASPWPWALGLVAAVVLVYAGGVGHPFIFDDVGAIALNPQIRSLSPSVALSPPAETPVGGRPLVNFAFALNYAAGGLDVQGYHVVNMALHAACALLIFGLVGLVARTVTASSGRIFAFMVALIWAVHPLNSEAVNYMTQRTELMMAACYLLTLYASARVTPGAAGRRWMFVAIAACAAGMACKESMVSAPILVLLFDRVYRHASFRDAWRERSTLYLGLMAAWLVLIVMMWSVPRTTSSGFATTHVSSWTYLLNQTEMIVRYFRLAVWPDSLVLYYGWATPTTLAAVWPYGIAVVGLLAASVVLFIRAPRAGFLALWCFLLLAPTSSIVPIGSEVGAERRMYLPLIGLVTLAAAGVATLAGQRRLQAAVVIGFLVAAALGYRTMDRTREYATALGMAQTVLERWPTPTAHYMVGTELITAGRPADAVPHLREAAAAIPPARFNLGSALIAINQQADGITELEAFLRAEPGLVSSRDARLLLARAYTEQQRTGDAVAILSPLIEGPTSDHAAHGLMAESLVAGGRHTEAIPHYESYLRSQGSDAAAWTGLGIAFMVSARPGDGVSAFRQAVVFAPGHAGYRMNLARALIDSGDPSAALEHARMAVQLTQGDPAAVELLRAAGGR